MQTKSNAARRSSKPAKRTPAKASAPGKASIKATVAKVRRAGGPTLEKAAAIRADGRDGQTIADEYGIHKSMVSRIRNNKLLSRPQSARRTLVWGTPLGMERGGQSGA